MADVQVMGDKAALANGASTLNFGGNANATRLLKGLNNMPTGRKVGFLGLLAVVLTGLIAAFFLSAQPSYKPLYAGLADEDGGAVTAALTQLGIPYRISESGSAILVPSDHVHDARLKLATQGLPKGRIMGFEILENQKMGVTQFQEQINFQRALEGELARSIQSLGAVRTARIHLAIPKPSVFLRDQQKPTASVVVSLHSGRTLDRAQIQGIVHLVSASVPELNAKNVSVVDQNGNLLTSDNTGDNLMGASSSALQYSQTLEGVFTKRVMDLLAPVYGAENIRASVTADLDFSQVERSDEIYKPNTDLTKAAIRSEQVSELRDGDSANPSGVPGVMSNSPPGDSSAPIGGARPGADAQNAGAKPKKRDATTNYELDRSTVTTRAQVGAIRRLSAAVLINDRLVTDEAGNSKLVPLTQDELDKVSSIVREAIGYSEARGDKVNVVNQSFNKTLEAAASYDQSGALMDLAKTMVTPLVAGLVAMALIFGVMRPMMKSSAKASEATAQAALQSAMAADAAESQVRDPLLENSAVASNALPRPDEDGVSVEFVGGADGQAVVMSAAGNQRQLDEVRRLARENPQLVANVVKSWIEAA